MNNEHVRITGHSVTSNAIWRLAERIGAQGVNFIVSVVLARILSPEDYGVVALTTTFTTLLSVFMTTGLGTALIQKKDIDELDCSTALLGNVGIGIIMYVIVFFAAPYIAEFYHQPLVKDVMRVLALTLVIGGLNGIQHAKVARAMKFRLFFKATLTGTLISAVVGIVLAIKGFGVWAIVAQHLTNQTIDTIFLSIMIGWKPDFNFSWQRFKPLFRYGSRAYGAQMLDTLYNSLRSLLIGRYYSGTDLAYYNRGRHIPALINQNTNNAVQSVMLPVYSRVADDQVKMKKLLRRALSFGTYLMFPCMMALALLSWELIEVLYTAKWLPAVPYMQISCVVFALTPMHVVNIQAILALGKSNISFRIELIKKSIAVLVMIICVHYSLMATAISAIPLGFFALFVNSWPVGKLADYHLSEQLMDALPAFWMSCVMGAMIYVTGMLPIAVLPKLFLQAIVGCVIYGLLSKLTHNKNYLFIKNYLLELLHKIVLKKKKDKET